MCALRYRNGYVAAQTIRLEGEVEPAFQVTFNAPLHKPCAKSAVSRYLHFADASLFPDDIQHAGAFLLVPCLP
jgi:hypothetical protein